MKSLIKTYLTIAFAFTCLIAKAQTPATAKDVLKQGIELNDAGKYPEAIEKYKEASRLDPSYPNPYYEIGYTLFNSGKGIEAIPYLEKYLNLEPGAGGGYDLLGSIYDDDHQADKAIDYYKQGITADPNYQRLYFNLSIAYYRQSKFTDAEEYAVKAIKLDPKHASSMRAYAMATYKEQKRECSLMAWCSFILQEPQTARSAEAYKYVRNILNYGITKTGEKSVNVAISNKELGTSTLMMQMAVLAATTDKKGLSVTDSLSLQLKSVFGILAEGSSKRTDAFYVNYLAKYFGSLAKTENMPTFTRVVSLAANPDDSKAWLKEHQKELTAFDNWVRFTERSF